MATFLLPQNDQSPDRAAKLDKARVDYGHNMNAHYPMANVVPPGWAANVSYTIPLLKEVLNRRANVEKVYASSGLKFTTSLPQRSVTEVAKLLQEHTTTNMIQFFTPDLGPVLPTGRPSSSDDYLKFFKHDPAPLAATFVQSDEWFANAYTAGSDPATLKRWTGPPDKFPINDSHFQTNPALSGDNFNQALAEGRIYYVDYELMSVLKNGQHPQGPKYMYAPMAAFAVPRGGSRIVPFAIQLSQNPNGADIYTPQDAWSWQIAKLMTQTATNAHSAIITHLAETHLLADPIALATVRNLATNHPLFALLKPHFFNTLAINHSAFKVLVGPDQFVDRMLGSSIDSNYQLITERRLAYDFKANYLPNRLARNGTVDSKALPDYAFRDDGMLIWNAINSWVAAYVSAYYPNESVIAADRELQAWAAEIGSANFGMVKNFASGSGVASVQELIDTVTMIIFTVGPMHAVVNFVQRTDMSFVPSAPMAGYIPQITGKGHSERDWLNCLPPLDVQQVQQTLCYLLGGIYYTSLGAYGKAFEASVASGLATYQKQLAAIEKTIEERNGHRMPYLHLLPSKIPQSINI